MKNGKKLEILIKKYKKSSSPKINYKQLRFIRKKKKKNSSLIKKSKSKKNNIKMKFLKENRCKTPLSQSKNSLLLSPRFKNNFLTCKNKNIDYSKNHLNFGSFEKNLKNSFFNDTKNSKFRSLKKKIKKSESSQRLLKKNDFLKNKSIDRKKKIKFDIKNLLKKKNNNLYKSIKKKISKENLIDKENENNNENIFSIKSKQKNLLKKINSIKLFSRPKKPLKVKKGSFKNLKSKKKKEDKNIFISNLKTEINEKNNLNKKDELLIKNLFKKKNIKNLDLINITDYILNIEKLIKCKNLFQNHLKLKTDILEYSLISLESCFKKSHLFFPEFISFLNLQIIFFFFMKKQQNDSNFDSEEFKKNIKVIIDIILDNFYQVLIFILKFYEINNKFNIEINYIDDFIKNANDSLKENKSVEKHFYNLKNNNFILRSKIKDHLNLKDEKIFENHLYKMILSSKMVSLKKCTQNCAKNFEILITQKTQKEKINLKKKKNLENLNIKRISICDEKNEPNFTFQPLLNFSKKKYPKKEKSKKYTLVLDLDETLIHFKEDDNLDLGGEFLVRPYVKEFLKEMHNYFEIFIYTAATKEYSDYILEHIDSENLISYRLYRQDTIFKDNRCFKDLGILGRDLKHVIFVDNNCDNFELQPRNGIHIKSWYGDSKDNALRQLGNILISIVQNYVEDVRNALSDMSKKFSTN